MSLPKDTGKVGYERHWQSGVKEIAKVSKRSQWDSIARPLDCQSHALSTEPPRPTNVRNGFFTGNLTHTPSSPLLYVTLEWASRMFSCNKRRHRSLGPGFALLQCEVGWGGGGGHCV